MIRCDQCHEKTFTGVYIDNKHFCMDCSNKLNKSVDLMNKTLSLYEHIKTSFL